MIDTVSLDHEFTYRTSVIGPEEVGTGPFGMRQYYAMRDGVVSGARISGTTAGDGSDWMLVGTDGYVRMDARIQIKTTDGALICVHYFGPAEFNERLRNAMAAGEATRFEEQRIRTHWLLESGDERYAWVNQCVMVGEGRFTPDAEGVAGFEHRVYRVA